MRRFVEADTRINLHKGVGIAGLLAEKNTSPPHMIGVVTDDGHDVRADLVVDCSGRRSKAGEYLTALGARPWKEEGHQSPENYITRHFRLKPGVVFPNPNQPEAEPQSYCGSVAFPSDNRSFALVISFSMNDPCRAAMAKDKTFNAIMAAIPRMAPWIAAGEPINEPLVLTQIHNSMRRLVDDQGPICTGFVLVGDSGMHTDPIMGRGTSLAFAQAQHLAKTAEQATDDPVAFAVQFDEWTRRNINSWFNSTATASAARVAQMQAALEGRELNLPPAARIVPALTAMAQEDPELAVQFARLNHLLIQPAAMFADGSLLARATERAATIPPMADSLPRKQFEAIVAG